MIHMTETRYEWWGGSWIVYCRCRWVQTGFATQAAARKGGDAHLAEGNGT